MAADHPDAFPETRWSRILDQGGGRDLDGLCRTYLGPIRAWLAVRSGRRDADLDDLTQEAFAWMLASGLLDKADPGRGRFRGFLKTALARFCIDLRRRETAGSRGGGRPHAALDAVVEPPADGTPSPDQVLDEAWRRALLERARQQLHAELEAGGRGVRYTLFHDAFLADDGAARPSHAELAARHGITRNDVSNWLDDAKRRYRTLLRELVRETVTDAAELQEELAWLFGPARGGTA